jgi:ribosome modulation factor
VEGAGTVASSWDELTGAEQNEARFRGFPREADTRYNVKRHYSDGEWMLTGWFKAGPGQPRTLTERMADYAAVDRSGLSPSDAVDSAIIRGDLDSWETPATVAPANMVAVGAVDGTFLALSAPAPVRLRQSRGPDGESRLEYANRIAAPVPSRNRTDNVEWHLGRNDYRAGITECPYADGGDRAARWAAGWQDAKEQAIRDNPESVEALKARIAALEEHIHALSDLLQGWPTIRALSASGARDASERKVKARATVAKMLDIMNREA